MVIDPSMWRILSTPTLVLKPLLQNRSSLVNIIDSYVGFQTEGYLITYVDDILVSSTREVTEAVLSAVKAIWTCSDGECTYNNQDVTFCALRIHKMLNGGYFLDQAPYTSDIITRHDLQNPSKVPLSSEECVLSDLVAKKKEEELSLIHI